MSLFKSRFCRGGKTYIICLSESGLFCILLNIRTFNSIYFCCKWRGFGPLSGWMKPHVLTYSSVIGPLGWSLNLAVVNSAPGNTGKQGVCNWLVWPPLGIFPGVLDLSHMVVLVLGFWDSFILFPVVGPVCSSRLMCVRLSVPSPIPTNSCYCLLNDGHSGVRGKFWLAFLWWLRMFNIFHRVMTVCIQFMCSFMDGGGCGVWCFTFWVSHTVWMLSPVTGLAGRDFPTLESLYSAPAVMQPLPSFMNPACQHLLLDLRSC